MKILYNKNDEKKKESIGSGLYGFIGTISTYTTDISLLVN